MKSILQSVYQSSYSKNEPLVRPMLGCNNIGDAQAKGVPIAWPSMLYGQTSFLNFTSMYIYGLICNVISYIFFVG
jgi:hypothetical protein